MKKCMTLALATLLVICSILNGCATKQYMLTMGVNGRGTTNPSTGTYLYDSGKSFIITAIPAGGWKFDGWSGDTSENRSTASIQMNGNKNITANFSKITYTLTVSMNGSGTVIPTTGAHAYDAGTAVAISANPSGGWSFDRWTGNVDSFKSSTTMVIMNSDMTVTANFMLSATPSTIPEALKIRVATDATWPPFEFINKLTTEIEGFDIDLFKAIAEKENIEVEFINVAWDPLLAGMTQGTYDAAISSISITAERQKVTLFSDPYYVAGQLIVVCINNTTIKSKADLSGKTVGVQLDTTGNFEVNNIAGVTAKTYDDIALAFQDLMNGQLDAVVADNTLVPRYVGRNPTRLKTAGEVFSTENYGIAVAKGKEDLLQRINSGLKKVLDEGIIETLSKKWLEK